MTHKEENKQGQCHTIRLQEFYCSGCGTKHEADNIPAPPPELEADIALQCKKCGRTYAVKKDGSTRQLTDAEARVVERGNMSLCLDTTASIVDFLRDEVAAKGFADKLVEHTGGNLVRALLIAKDVAERIKQKMRGEIEKAETETKGEAAE